MLKSQRQGKKLDRQPAREPVKVSCHKSNRHGVQDEGQVRLHIMSTILTGTFCGLPTGYGLGFTCSGPDCTLVGNLTTLKCNTSDSVVSCSNGKTCGGSNFTDTFTLRSDAGGLSAYDIFNVAGNQSTLISNYTASGTSKNISTNATSTGSAPAATTSSGSAIAKQSRTSVYAVLVFWLVFTLLIPAVAAELHDPANQAELSVQNASQALLLPRANGAREAFKLTAQAETLVKASADILLASAKSGDQHFDASGFSQQVFDTLRNSLLPASVNIEIDILEGRQEDAIKDATKEVAERLLQLAIAGAAPETGGASLLLLLTTHVAVDIAVDELFKGLHVVTDFPQTSFGHIGNTTGQTNTTAGSSSLAGGTNQTYGGPGGMACDPGNYGSSPWFYRDNEFGTDEWRDCKFCCVDWGLARFPQWNGVCGCCTLVSVAAIAIEDFTTDQQAGCTTRGSKSTLLPSRLLRHLLCYRLSTWSKSMRVETQCPEKAA